MNKKKMVLAAAALAGLSLAGCASYGNKGNSDSVMCYGVNSCKGHGSCAGKIDACNGKNGCEAQLSCAGKNSCKGKGILKMSKKECLNKNGKVAM